MEVGKRHKGRGGRREIKGGRKRRRRRKRKKRSEGVNGRGSDGRQDLYNVMMLCVCVCVCVRGKGRERNAKNEENIFVKSSFHPGFSDANDILINYKTTTWLIYIYILFIYIYFFLSIYYFLFYFILFYYYYFFFMEDCSVFF